jgi:hypothetical protein
LELVVSYQLINLLKKFKDIFVWIYKDLEGTPPKIAQHHIELDTSIPLVHQIRYKLNPNYATIVKHDIDKLLVDALPSPGVNPLEGSTMCSCGKLGLGRHSRLLAL